MSAKIVTTTDEFGRIFKIDERGNGVMIVPERKVKYVGDKLITLPKTVFGIEKQEECFGRFIGRLVFGDKKRGPIYGRNAIC